MIAYVGGDLRCAATHSCRWAGTAACTPAAGDTAHATPGVARPVFLHSWNCRTTAFSAPARVLTFIEQVNDVLRVVGICCYKCGWVVCVVVVLCCCVQASTATGRAED